MSQPDNANTTANSTGNQTTSTLPENLIQFGHCTITNQKFNQSTAGFDFAIVMNKDPLMQLELGLNPNDLRMADSKIIQFSVPLEILPYKTANGYELIYSVTYGMNTTAGIHACFVFDLNGEVEVVQLPFGETKIVPFEVLRHITSIEAPEGLKTELVIGAALFIQRKTPLDHGMVNIDGIDISVQVK
jgi:hypothetical protein